jgi:hypothetical protein
MTHRTADEQSLSGASAPYKAQDLERLLAVVTDEVDRPGGPRTSARLRRHGAVRAHRTETVVLFDVELASRSTSSPTGSPTTAKLRVETPASIRSITARVSGSRSAKYP